MSDFEGGYVHWEQNLAALTAASERIATALERATPAREDRRPQLAWWVGEVERLKDCVTRAERELAAVAQNARVYMEERDAARASSEKFRGALEKIGDMLFIADRSALMEVAQAALDQAGDIAHAPSGDRA